MDNSNEHSKSPESDHKEIEASEYLDKDCKITVLNVLREIKQHMDRQLKEIRKTIYEQNKNICREVEIKTINSGAEKHSN